MWARAHLAATCGLRVEREVRVAFDAAVAGTLGKNALVSPNDKNKNPSAGGTSVSFKSKELSQVFWHYASLNVAPADSLWRALDAAALQTSAVRVAHGRLAHAVGVRDAGEGAVAPNLGGDGTTSTNARLARDGRVRAGGGKALGVGESGAARAEKKADRFQTR
jgi:hypothetical protein